MRNVALGIALAFCAFAGIVVLAARSSAQRGELGISLHAGEQP